MTGSSIKLGLIAFCNDGGLGAQTRRLYKMLGPDKVLLIDSRPFSKNNQFHPEWYPGAQITRGFPRNYDCLEFLEGLTHVFTVENPYNFYLVRAAHERGIKVICQTNYEFCENVAAPWLPVPDLFAMPSYWKLDEMADQFGEDNVTYLPPPIDPDEFEDTRIVNMNRTGRPRFLHIAGTLAYKDRNGTLDLLAALKFSKESFELVIRSQHPLPIEYATEDLRVKFVIGNIEKNSDLYKDHDGLILPRRYGGLSLTTNEALMSGLPVMMTDISPNDKLLPFGWRVTAEKKGTLEARMPIDYYSADHQLLGERLDTWANKLPDKENAFSRGYSNFSPQRLAPQYAKVLASV